MYRLRVNNSKKQQSVESAIKSFDGQHIPYDSVYAKNDTVSFYNNGAPVGMTVTTTE